MVEPADNPSVGFVSADFGRDGETYSADIPGSELPQPLQPGYDSAQLGDTHYQIVGHQKLYQEVYALLSDVISAHAIKR